MNLLNDLSGVPDIAYTFFTNFRADRNLSFASKKVSFNLILIRISAFVLRPTRPLTESLECVLFFSILLFFIIPIDFALFKISLFGNLFIISTFLIKNNLPLSEILKI